MPCRSRMTSIFRCRAISAASTDWRPSRCSIVGRDCNMRAEGPRMKISIIGVGKVGTALGFAFVTRGLCDQLVLVGRTRSSALGDAHDLAHASAFVRPMNVLAGGIADTGGSDIIIFTASVPMRDKSSRFSVAQGNSKLYRKLVPAIT